MRRVIAVRGGRVLSRERRADAVYFNVGKDRIQQPVREPPGAAIPERCRKK